MALINPRNHTFSNEPGDGTRPVVLRMLEGTEGQCEPEYIFDFGNLDGVKKTPKSKLFYRRKKAFGKVLRTY